MQVAKINADNEVEEIGELKALFPNTSFPANGPNSDWYTANNVICLLIQQNKNKKVLTPILMMVWCTRLG